MPDPRTLNELYFLAMSDFGQRPVAMRSKLTGSWTDLSYAQLADQVQSFSLGLRELGVKPGDHVAILSENRPEWAITDYACLTARCADVPIYPTLPAKQIEYILRDSESVVACVSSAAQLQKVQEVRANLPKLKHVIVFDPAVTGADVLNFANVVERGRAAAARYPTWKEDALGAKPDDLATIIYTSGTTNRPKGVMLSQRNLVTNSLAGSDAIASDCTALWFNWLPYSHIFARLVDHYSTTRMGMTVALAQSAATVLDDLREVEPSYFSSVPRLLEKIWAHVVSFPPEKRAKEAQRLVGRRLIQISSGGAPLPVHVANELRDAGVIVLEGYGLTETSPIVSFNRREEWMVGTVGRAIPGVELRIADDGEILTRGPHIMQGYWREPEATAAAIEQDGWFHTGDIGTLNSEGYLSITGRKKDLIVTAGGKNVVPAALEAMLIQDPFIEQALVYGDRRPFCVAMIVPKFERIKEAVRESNGAFSTDEPVVTDANLLAWFQKRVDAALREVSNVERAKKIVVLTHALSLDLDEVTVTQKVRRAAVFQRYQQYLDALYQGSSE